MTKSGEPEVKRPCVFFDRDGVINRSPGPGYVLRWEDFHLQDGIVDAVRTARDLGYGAVVVTSQRGVGKGLMTREELERIHRNMQGELEAADAAFDAIYACTGEPGCLYPNKPDPGMIDAACKDHGLDASLSWMVGDADRDIEMGRRAGLRGAIRVKSEKAISVEADYTLSHVRELADLLRKIL